MTTISPRSQPYSWGLKQQVACRPLVIAFLRLNPPRQVKLT